MSALLEMLMGTNSVEKEMPNLNPVFKLPITYLPADSVFTLNPVVAADLELVGLSEPETDCTDKPETYKPGMYDYVFQPKHVFAKELIPQWSQHITTNTDFLEDSQKIVKSMDKYSGEIGPYDLCCNSLLDIWKAAKEDPNFFERYSYMEFDMFKYLNKMPSFLQGVSMINMLSPVLSFVMPIMFLIFPFILLKIQGLPISFSLYLNVLKDIAKYHFLGKAISGLSNFSFQNLLYVFMIFGFYLYSLYNNYMACCRFYKNINNVNLYLTNLKEYLSYSSRSMDIFTDIIRDKPSYAEFRQDVVKHSSVLKEMRLYLSNINPFEPSLYKVSEIGGLLNCFYELHENKDFEISFKYSFGFEGYINNLLGIHSNFVEKRIGGASFINAEDLDIDSESDIDSCSDAIDKPSISIVGQYYPPHSNDCCIKNNCSLDKNLVITGPNASGKTTYLKTTTINIIFSQQFGFGYYESFALTPYTHIHSYLNIPDTSGRDSLFQAESRRCKEIIQQITEADSHKHFCIFDELYSGTNPVEATKSAYSFLKYLNGFPNVDFILTTHYVSICERLDKSDKIQNMKMDAIMSDSGDISYVYTISPGISRIQGAASVLKAMDYPSEILKDIADYIDEDDA